MRCLGKVLYITTLCFSIFVSNNAFAYDKGQPFTNLPVDDEHRNNINKFASATVGISTNIGRCTGIRISRGNYFDRCTLLGRY